MRPRTVSAALAGVVTALVACGCGITDPYPTHASRTSAASIPPSATSTSTSTSATSTAADELDPAPERDGTISSRERSSQDLVSRTAGSRTARGAVLRYAALYVNWTARGLPARQRQLAHLSIGAAREQARQEAASAPTDRPLVSEHVANHGQVISAQPGLGPASGRWVIVAREQTTGQGSYHGLPVQLHVTYAIATHTHHGWVVSQWSPQT